MPENNIKGPGIKYSNNDDNFYLSGIIPGFNEPGNINIHNSNINIDPNINNKNLELPNKNINIIGESSIKGSNAKINGEAPGIDIKRPNINMRSGNINLKGPDINNNINGNILKTNFNEQELDLNMNTDTNNFYLSGIIRGKKSKDIKINIPSTNVDINKPEIKSPEIKINGNAPDINIKPSNPKISVNKDLNISGIIPGNDNLHIPNKNVNMNLDLKNPNKIDINANHKVTNSYMSGIIEGINSKSKINIPDINLKGPNLKRVNVKVEGKSPKLEINPNINLPSGNENIEINKDININGSIPEFKKNLHELEIKGTVPKYDIKGPKLKSSEIDINKDIPDIKMENNIGLPSHNIKLKGPNLNQGIDINGNLPGIGVDGPKIDTNLNIKNSDILNSNPKTSFFLSGVIEGKKDKIRIEDSNYVNTNINIGDPKLNVNGNLPKLKVNTSKIDINEAKSNINLKGPNADLSGTIPGINVKSSKINMPLGDINIKGPEFQNNINGSMQNVDLNIPNPNINGNGNIGENLNIKGKNPSITDNIPEFNSQKINVNGPSVNIGKSILSSNNEFFISGLIPSKNEKNGNIKKINNNIPDMNISAKGPSINANGFHGSLYNKYNFDENEIKGSRRLINYDGMNNNINIGIPKTNKEFNLVKSDKIENLGDEINLLKNKPTNLDIKNDNKYGMNVNIDGEIKEDINLDNLGKNFISEENDTKVLSSSARGGEKKKLKSLPMVGTKSNNFKASKIDAAGKFDADNINIDNMKSANVGVNGQKIGERIVE